MTSITLKPTSADDLSFLQDLWNDGRVMQWVGFPNGVGVTEEAINKWYDQRVSLPHFHHFIVLDEYEKRCGEVHFDLVGAYAGLDIKLCIEVQGKGIATRALSAVIDKAFEFSDACEYVWTEPSLVNTAARRLYTRCGLSESPRPPAMAGDDPFWTLSRDHWQELKRST